MREEEWLSYVLAEDGTDDAAISHPDGLMSLLRSIYATLGALEQRDLWLEIARRQFAVATAVLSGLEPGLAGHAREIRLRVELDDNEGFDVSLVSDDRAPLTALRAEGVLVEVASFVQEVLMLEHHTVWPVCPVHGVGLHIGTPDDGPVWECLVGGHVVRRVASSQQRCTERP